MQEWVALPASHHKAFKGLADAALASVSAAT